MTNPPQPEEWEDEWEEWEDEDDEERVMSAREWAEIRELLIMIKQEIDRREMSIELRLQMEKVADLLGLHTTNY